MYFMIDSRSIPQVRLVNETAIEPPYVHRSRFLVAGVNSILLCWS